MSRSHRQFQSLKSQENKFRQNVNKQGAWASNTYITVTGTRKINTPSKLKHKISALQLQKNKLMCDDTQAHYIS